MRRGSERRHASKGSDFERLWAARCNTLLVVPSHLSQLTHALPGRRPFEPPPTENLANVKALYDSGWHHPFAAYVGVGVLLALLPRTRRDPFLFGYLALFGLVIAADATVTGAWSPLSSTSPLYTPLSIAFVILGDARYFVLQERYLRPEASLGRILAVALPLSFVVPVTSVLLRQLLSFLGEGRWLFLSYELLALTLVVTLWRTRHRHAPRPDDRRWLRSAAMLFATLYALWATADIVLLAGAPIGHLLRIVPNVLYYAVFLAFVAARAPRREAS